MKQVIFFILISLFFSFTYCQTNNNWKRCAVIPGLNVTCIDAQIYNDINNELSFSFTLDDIEYLNFTYQANQTTNQYCVDQISLVKIMNNSPSLEKYEQQIYQDIKLYHVIPSENYSICIDLVDVQEENDNLSGCVNLLTTLMCFENSCFYQNSNTFGCFSFSF
eukprot:TRINITY_DN16015_c0_g1_i1.p1 TRINITY_DN16015_c0_g1~~TRINITY_DN16015_c0_g1_i1.p1  ORF type:complete len:164 (-),score=33.09 TRINITY_DN16015_c0_g1_i1:24-515(-)